MGKSAKFNEQKYVEVALSKDIGRGALEYVYRDKDRLIGCDGHRLHMIRGLPVVEKSYLIAAGSYDGEYPQYELVLSEKKRFLSNILVDKRDMKRLKALSDLIGVENNPVASLHTENNNLYVSHENLAGTVRAQIIIELEKTPSIPLEKSNLGIDLRYLYQALIQDVEMEVYIADDRGLVLECSAPSINSYALIMAARI